MTRSPVEREFAPLIGCPATGHAVHRVWEDPEGGDRCLDCNLLRKFCLDVKVVIP